MDKAEFGFPGPLRDQLVGAILAGTKTSTTGLVVDYEHAIDEGEGDTSVAGWRANHESFWHSPEMRAALDDPTFTVDDSTETVLWRFRLVTDLRPV